MESYFVHRNICFVLFPIILTKSEICVLLLYNMCIYMDNMQKYGIIFCT